MINTFSSFCLNVFLIIFLIQKYFFILKMFLFERFFYLKENEKFFLRKEVTLGTFLTAVKKFVGKSVIYFQLSGGWLVSDPIKSWFCVIISFRVVSLLNFIMKKPVEMALKIFAGKIAFTLCCVLAYQMVIILVWTLISLAIIQFVLKSVTICNC